MKDLMRKIEKVKEALLCMQRYSWEQGVAAQAFLESGETGRAILLAKEAVVRQLRDGRPGVIGGLTAVTDPVSIGEALIYAAESTGDEKLKTANQKALDWILNKAPRNLDGAIYHLDDKAQVWVDSYYMAPPFMSAAGYHHEALAVMNAYRRVLLDPEKKMFAHKWDDGSKNFIRKEFWGVGNGWALAGMARVVDMLPRDMDVERERLAGQIMETAEACVAYMRDDGLFHDVIDNPETFVETNFAQMLAYTLYRGMTAGWCPRSYLRLAEKMRSAAQGKVDDYGLVQGVCGAPSFNSPGTAPEGQAFFILMEAAADRFRKSNR
jgi:rhamnogalacturonyl hydrolase YesR